MAELALSRRTARSAARALSVALAADSGVTHVGVGWKLTGGTPTDQLALKVFVTRKHDQPTVAVPDSFTHAGQEYATDVVRTGARPRLTLAGGDRIFAGNGVPGVCGLVFTYLGKTYGLTNAHVVGGAGGPASRPVTGLSNGQTIVLGRVAYASNLSPGGLIGEDAAAILVNNPALVRPYVMAHDDTLVTREGQIDPRTRNYWFAFEGAVFQCGDADYIDRIEIRGSGGSLLYANVWQLRMMQGAMVPGLSGSLLCRREGDENVACGLIFGRVGPGYALAFQFTPLFTSVLAGLP